MNYYWTMESPVGRLHLTSDGEALTGLHFRAQDIGDAVESEKPFTSALAQLAAYFAGELSDFDLRYRLTRGTEFQQKVWRALAEIPFGATASYGDIAARIGAPKAVRAVGAANGQNPLSIILPCHRVIGGNGSLTGYGGGLDRKQWLLTHEAACAGTDRPLPARELC